MVRRGLFVVALVCAGVALGSLVAQPQRPPGTTEVRPGQFRAPEFPPPSIVDYRPKSTLVVAEHLTPRAKYPVVDIHSHQPTPISPARLSQVVKEMDQLNLRVIVNLSGGWGDRLRRGLEAIRTSPYPDRMVLFANIDFSGVGPGFGQKAAAQLEADVKAGAVGLKIFKELGLRIRKADGSRLHVDDPELDPIWDACARLNVPVLVHTAEPQAFFEPIDDTNERWLEESLFPDRRYQDPSFPRWEELVAERDRMFKKHPRTRFIAAHFGWHANDLARAARELDAMPNVCFDVSAVLYDFGRQPRAARAFFIRYQDRILFGKDAYQATEYPYYWRVFETADEYFDYYRDYHAFWKLYGMDLPDEVLRKLYYRNALTLTPGLPRAGFPE